MVAVLASGMMAQPTSALGFAGRQPADAVSQCPATIPRVETLAGAKTYIYKTVGRRELRIHVFSPEPSGRLHPGALFIVGGGFRTADLRGFARHAREFVARGYVSAVADYRTLCGDQVPASAGVEDVEDAHAWLRRNAPRLTVDRNRIVLVGSSAGGLLVTATALRKRASNRPAALVLFNPVTNLAVGPWADGIPPGLLRRSSPSRLPIKGLPPTIVFHGTADRIVPIDTARQFCARAVAAHRICRLEEYSGQGHTFYFQQDVLPQLGVAPYQDTLSKAIDFLGKLPAMSKAR